MNTKQELIALCDSILIPQSTCCTVTGIQEELSNRLAGSEIFADFMLDLSTGMSESLMAYYPNNIESQFNDLVNDIKQALEFDSIDLLEQKKQGTFEQLRNKISSIEELVIKGMSYRGSEFWEEASSTLNTEELEACANTIENSISDLYEISRKYSFATIDVIISGLDQLQEEVREKLYYTNVRERVSEILESAKIVVHQYFADLQGKIDLLRQGLDALKARSLENQRLADLMSQPLSHDQIAIILKQIIDRLTQEQKEEAQKLFK